MELGEKVEHEGAGICVGSDTGRIIAKFSHESEAEAFCLVANAEKQLTKKPVVPWVGAHVEGIGGGSYYYGEASIPKHFGEIIDSPLHPQFMPNDGENPWPDGMFVQVAFPEGKYGEGPAESFRWDLYGGYGEIIGSRPACGWAEYLKGRENG